MKARDDEAFDAFVRSEGPMLLRLAAAVAGRPAAEDLLQSALVKTYASWPRVCASDVPALYVRRVLLNEATSGWRSRRRRPAELLGATPPEPITPGGFTAVLDRAELAQLLATLGRRQRAILVLRYLEDRPDEEIAQLLGCTMSTVRSQAARALAQLRSHAPTPTPTGSAS